MSKKPMTWLELIKLKLNEEKAKGNSPSIGDVTPTAKLHLQARLQDGVYIESLGCKMPLKLKMINA